MNPPLASPIPTPIPKSYSTSLALCPYPINNRPHTNFVACYAILLLPLFLNGLPRFFPPGLLPRLLIRLSQRVDNGFAFLEFVVVVHIQAVGEHELVHVVPSAVLEPGSLGELFGLGRGCVGGGWRHVFGWSNVDVLRYGGRDVIEGCVYEDRERVWEA